MLIQPFSNAQVAPLGPAGARQAVAAPASSAVAAPTDQVQVGSASFALRSEAGQYLALAPDGQATTVGRQPGSLVQINDGSVSRDHAMLCVRDGQLWVRDSGSTNGTRFNGHPLEAQQWYPVPMGTILKFGDQAFMVQPPPTTTAVSAPGTPPVDRARLQDVGVQNAMRASAGAVGSVASPALQVATETLQLVTPDGQAFPLRADGQAMRVGRASESDIRLGSGLISRSHGEVRVVDGQVQVRDLGSSNGTRINGHTLPAQQWYLLGDGAEVTFGGQSMHVVREKQATPAQTQASQPATAAQHLQAAQAAQAARQAQGGAPLANLNQLMARAAAAVGVGGPVGAALTLESLREFSTRTRPESKAAYLGSLQGAQAQMLRTDGIVDLEPGIPTLMIPDLHARRDFLVRVLDAEIGGEKVFNLLQQGRLNLVCLGDGMHAEGRAKERWQDAVGEFFQNRGQSASLDQEMTESLGTMKMIMDLKTAFPDTFHYVRGNHDDVDGHNFRKYAGAIGESVLTREWIKNNFGPDFVEQYAAFEKSMPLMVRGQGFVATHAAPGASLSRNQIAGRTQEAFDALAWTDNLSWGTAGNAPERQTLRATLEQVGAHPDSTWFVGHRTVQDGLYRSQLGGQLVQVNAPNDHVVVMVGPQGQFDPDRNVVRL